MGSSLNDNKPLGFYIQLIFGAASAGKVNPLGFFGSAGNPIRVCWLFGCSYHDVGVLNVGYRESVS